MTNRFLYLTFIFLFLAQNQLINSATRSPETDQANQKFYIENAMILVEQALKEADFTKLFEYREKYRYYPMLNDMIDNALTTRYLNRRKAVESLSESVKFNNFEDVISAIQAGANVNEQDKYGNTPLIYAIRIGNLAIINFLLFNNADIQINTPVPALMEAVITNKPEIVTLILEKNPNVNQESTFYHRTALIQAAQQSNIDIMFDLINKYRASINEQDKFGDTALILALKNRNFDAIDMLLLAGAEVNIINIYGESYLTIIRQPGYERFATAYDRFTKSIYAQQIRSTNASINLTRQLPKVLKPIVLQYAKHTVDQIDEATKALWKSIEDVDEAGVQKAINNGANVNVLNEDHSSPLISAMIKYQSMPKKDTKENERCILGMIFSKEDDPYYEYKTKIKTLKNSTLMRIIESIIKAGANVNLEVNRIGDSALIYSLYGNFTNLNFNLFRMLIERGADINAMNMHGQTALILSLERLLCPSGVTRFNDIFPVKLLLDKGANVNIRNQSKQNALMLAVQSIQDVEILQILIDRTEDINAVDYMERTALHRAIISNNEIATKILLNTTGIDLNIRDSRGNNALFYALDNNNLELFKLLLESGTDIHSVDNDGNNILMAAIGHKSSKIIKILLENTNVNINAINNHGHTALTMAARLNDSDLLNRLLHSGADITIARERFNMEINCEGNEKCLSVFQEFQKKLNATIDT